MKILHAHIKSIKKHFHTHHKTYIGGIFAGFALAKTFVLLAGFFGLSFFGQSFAVDLEEEGTRNAVSIVGIPRVGQPLTGFYDTTSKRWKTAFASSGTIEYTLFDTQNTIYVGYRYRGEEGDVRMITKKEGNDRVNIGDFTGGDISNFLLNDDIPYIQYDTTDENGEGMTAILQRDGTQRVQLGDAFSGSIELSLKDSQLYLQHGYTDENENAMTTILQRNNSQRVQLGDAFSGNLLGKNIGLSNTFNFPYLSTYEEDIEAISKIFKRDGTQRVQLGDAFSGTTSLIIDNSTLYIHHQYVNENGEDMADILQRNNSQRVELGDAFSGSIHLSFKDTIPYLQHGYTDENGNNLATILQRDNTQRVQLGDVFSGNLDGLKVGSSTKNIFDFPYLSYSYKADGVLVSKVLKRDGTERMQLGDVFNNPDNRNIRLLLHNSTLYIQNIYGKNIVQILQRSGTQRIPLGDAFSTVVSPTLYFNQNETPYVITLNKSEGLSNLLKYENDIGGSQTYQRYKNDEPIEGATGISYTPTMDDVGGTLSFGIRIGTEGSADTKEIMSQGVYIPSIPLPIVSNVAIVGTPRVRSILTGSYSYSYHAWYPVGTLGFSESAINYTSFAIDATGNQYVAYSDKDGKITVMEFDGTNRQSLGTPGFSDSEAYSFSLALDNTGTPFIAYRDINNDFKATVMKFDGENRSSVGNSGFSENEAYSFSLALDNTGMPLVAYGDGTNAHASVMKFDGTNRNYVGNSGFSYGNVVRPSIALANDGTPYVAYTDKDIAWKAMVMKFDGTDRVAVGTPGFSTGEAFYTSLALTSDGTPYVAYSDRAYNGKAVVMKFDGTNRVAVGTPGFSEGEATEVDIVFNNMGIPFIIYRDKYYGKVVIMKLNNDNWIAVGTPGFSEGDSYASSLALDFTGTPFVAYADSIFNGKISVMQYHDNLDPEGTSRYQWYKNDEPIDGATGITYTPTTDDIGQEISFGVQPRSLSAIEGEMVQSSSVTIAPPPPSPLSDVFIIGKPNIGLSLTGALWMTLGDYLPGRCRGDTSFVDKNGTLYVVTSVQNHYIDSNGYNYTEITSTIQTWTGNAWTTIGTPFTGTNISLVVDTNLHPIVAYSEDNSGIHVIKWNGTDRERVGNNISESIGSLDNLFLDNSGKLYIVCRDNNNYHITIQTLSGSERTTIGTFGGTNNYNYNYEFFMVSKNGVPYVVYNDVNNGELITVKQWDGANRNTVGTPGLTKNLSGNASLGIDTNGTVYIAMQGYPGIYGKPAMVMKFNRTDREMVGDKLSVELSSQIISFDKNNVPYITYNDKARSRENSIVKFDGTAWVRVPIPGDSINDTRYLLYKQMAENGRRPDEIKERREKNKIASPAFFDNQNSMFVLYQNSTGTSLMKYTTLPETGMTYQWYRDSEAISGANTPVYTPTPSDSNKQIYFEATPEGFGPVASKSLRINTLPTATGLSISGIPDVQQPLTAHYSYQDHNYGIWTPVGNTVFGSKETNRNFGWGGYIPYSLIVNSTGTPYVFYQNADDVPKVMTFSGGSWQTILSGLADGQEMLRHAFMMGTNDTPYIGYLDQNNDTMTFIHYSTTGWQEFLTTPLTVEEAIQATYFMIDAHEQLYNYGGGDGVIGFRQYISGEWQGTTVVDEEYPADIAIQKCIPTSNNKFYCAYISSFSTIVVMQGSGSQRTTKTIADIGNMDFLQGLPPDQKKEILINALALDDTGTPYLIYPEWNNGLSRIIGGRATVVKYTGTAWATVGEVGFSGGPETTAEWTQEQVMEAGIGIRNPSLAFDNYNNPYAIYADGYADRKPSIMKYNLRDPESVPHYQRYRGNSPIVGATEYTYIPGVNDAGRTISFALIPTAREGSSPGIAQRSAGIVLSGELVTICNDGIAEGHEVCDEGSLNGQVGHCNATCSATIPVPVVAVSHGGGSMLVKDTCPAQRDCSSSYYDNLCGPCTSTGTVHASASSCTAYSDELNTAYGFALDNGITSIKSCTTAHLTDSLLRSHLAKMIAQFAVKVLKKQPDTSKSCLFDDMQSSSQEIQFYSKLACQLGLMGYETDGITKKQSFDPSEIVDRAQFGTVLSRLLRGTTYAGGFPYYSKHLQALQINNIMKNVSGPNTEEIRGYALLMLQRAAK